MNLDEQENTNFGVYHESTIQIEAREGFNRVTTLDYENYIFVIENADEQFTGRNKGDVISYVYDGGMLLARVEQIDVDGTTVTIQGGELALNEVFSHLKLESGAAPDNADALMPMGGALEGDETITVPVKESLKEQKFLGGKVTLSLDLSGSLTAGIDFYLALDKQEVEFTMTFEISFGFTAEVKGEAGRFRIPLSLIPIPIIPGTVDGLVTPSLQVEFAASVTGTASVNAVVGVSVSHSGWSLPRFKNLCRKPRFETSVKIEGTVFIGLDLETSIVIGSGTAQVSLNFKSGLELVGTFAEVTLGDGIYHDCGGLCIKGKANLLFSAYTKARLLVDPVEKTLVEKRLRLKGMDFYACAKHGKAGKGECPHMLRKVTVTVKDENGEPVYIATVNSPEGKFLPPADELTNIDGVVILYLPEGTHKITAETAMLTGKKTVKVGDEAKKVNIKLKPRKAEGGEEEEDDDALDGSGNAGLVDYGKVAATGECGAEFKWTLYESGLLLVEGEGAMDDYSSSYPYLNRAPWYDYRDQITRLIVGEGITNIGSYAFYDLDQMRFADLPDSLETIEDHAFFSCASLYEVIIPDQVTYIGIAAFSRCSSVDTIILGDSLTDIDDSAFSNSSFRVLYLGSSLMHIGAGAFATSVGYSTGKREAIHVPTLQDWLDIQFEKGISIIDNFMLSSTGLYIDGVLCTELVIPENAEVRNPYSFVNYDRLLSVTLPESMSAIPDGMFLDCDNLRQVTISGNVKSIGRFAFSQCPRLEAVEIPASVETVETGAFSFCERLYRVSIQGNNASIGYQAFAGCTLLHDVFIGEGVSYIAPLAFAYCYDDKEIYFYGDAPEVIPDIPPEYDESGPPFATIATVYYPAGNPTWTEEAMLALGGIPNVESALTWVPYTPDSGNALRSDISVCAATEKPSVGIDAIFGGEYDTGEEDGVQVRTADFDGLAPGGEYVLLVLASPENRDRLAADNLLYISHATSTEDGTASFTYIPKTPVAHPVVVLCGPSGKDLKDAEITLPEMKPDGEVHAVEPTVVYDGITLIEGEDYELTGDVSFVEEGTYTFRINGIRDYTGVVEYTYTVLGHEHEFAEYIPDGNATCTEDGTRTAKCLHCDLTDTRPDPGSALGHSWDEGVITQEPTYETWGEKCFTCTVCGATKTEPVEPVHQHRFAFFEVVEPTCFSKGYEVYYCQDCGEVLHDNFTPMLDHTWDEGVVSVEPTVDHEGEMRYTCTVCAATKTEAIPKLHVHTNMVLRKVDPTCLDRGYTIYMCTDCGEVTFDDYLDALGHSFGQWTDVGGGMEERTCQRCGHTEQQPVGGPVNPFTDVPEGSFYYEPVLWAVRNGITAGTTPTTFGPNDKCMRAHVVTFLWRAAGSPEPTRTDNPFVDVKSTDFYYKPVLWAVENGITAGLDATHFGPTSYCNRAQVVTFLYRTMNYPEVTAADNPFTDVQAGSFYYKPVLWAMENGVTAGLTATAFGPNSICNRAQIVTFLYRAFVD